MIDQCYFSSPALGLIAVQISSAVCLNVKIITSGETSSSSTFITEKLPNGSSLIKTLQNLAKLE